MPISKEGRSFGVLHERMDRGTGKVRDMSPREVEMSELHGELNNGTKK